MWGCRPGGGAGCERALRPCRERRRVPGRRINLRVRLASVGVAKAPNGRGFSPIWRTSELVAEELRDLHPATRYRSLLRCGYGGPGAAYDAVASPTPRKLETERKNIHRKRLT